MNFSRREAVDTRDAFRSMSAYLDRLRKGDLEKVVIVRTNGRVPEAVGVLLTPDRYEELLRARA